MTRNLNSSFLNVELIMTPEDSSPTAPAPSQLVRPKWCSLWVWQLFILVAGVVTIIVGIILLPAPGPGSLVIYAGIGILATEFVWAKQLFTRIGDIAKQLLMRIRVWVKQMWRHKEP
jgi:uncharacterized protein (TIGR02611 family)